MTRDECLRRIFPLIWNIMGYNVIHADVARILLGPRRFSEMELDKIRCWPGGDCFYFWNVLDYCGDPTKGSTVYSIGIE